MPGGNERRNLPASPGLSHPTLSTVATITASPAAPFVDADGLLAAARAAKKAAGLTNRDVAGRLGVSDGAVSLALSGQPSRDGTRRRIVEDLTGADVEGPFWRIVGAASDVSTDTPEAAL